jgi:hypothetical protein
MKASSNFERVSPKEFAKARETVQVVIKSPSSEPIHYRNHLSYNVKNPKNYSLGPKKG